MNAKEKLLIGKYGKLRGSQAKLARELNVKQGVVAKWFSGDRAVGLDYILKLKNIFEVKNKAINNYVGKNTGTLKQMVYNSSDITLMQEKIKVLELEIELLKNEKKHK
ncbi:helix-turn-helix domain-containing protein [Candidatus Endomicrobiellum devescovinae]|jgi:transcriptional regulator with XRE-family HTH domain|uniref:helix-turn-helix domain-containing protein n=1 Tax=Candidatus Endomicrobiellum devescovinae TaxID=3242322 RepID=UPI0028194AA2|nr:helix-turn-helix domain-containing protein [Endomicrobium sp.]